MFRFLILTYLLHTQLIHAQYLRSAIEGLAGANYYKSTGLGYPEKDYQGVAFYYGGSAKLLIGNHLSLNVNAGVKLYPYYSDDYFVGCSMQTFVYRDYQTGFSAFLQGGLELSDWGDITIPFYLGTTQYFAEQLCFNFRLRVPTFLDVVWLETAGHIESGIEVGLQYDFRFNRQKEITRSGNPFILD